MKTGGRLIQNAIKNPLRVSSAVVGAKDFVSRDHRNRRQRPHMNVSGCILQHLISLCVVNRDTAVTEVKRKRRVESRPRLAAGFQADETKKLIAEILSLKWQRVASKNKDREANKAEVCATSRGDRHVYPPNPDRMLLAARLV